MPRKEHRKPCGFCGRDRYLMPGEPVCGSCIEDPDYLALVRHNAIVDRRNAKAKTQPKPNKEDA